MIPLSAFEAYGIELEYMIVDRETLSVRPIADTLLKNASGEVVNELPRNGMGWSNELTLHLIEVKNKHPASDLLSLVNAFQIEIGEINQLLEKAGACLMPGGMHPWMDPATETRLWPHDHAEIYQAYDNIFGCQQHGFANLQSMHLNLPFKDDAQFARLHAAVRLVLPILPALSASSPILEGQPTGMLDNRLQAYCHHQARLPATVGQVIPDTMASQAEYQSWVLQPMYQETAAFDPQGLLKHEWFNARGVIPRFERMALEIRLIDCQETPRADLAIAAAVSAVVQHVYNGDVADLPAQQAYPTHLLAALLHDCIRDADQAIIEDPAYLDLLGLPRNPCGTRDAWRQLIGQWWKRQPDQRTIWGESLGVILDQGPLSRRILRALDKDGSPRHLQEIYRMLCHCLASGRTFMGPEA